MTSVERKQGNRLLHHIKSNSRKWSQTETNHFYTLLGHFGVDFTLMSYHPVFDKKRSRKELSSKFKKEMKNHPSNVNSILNKID